MFSPGLWQYRKFWTNCRKGRVKSWMAVPAMTWRGRWATWLLTRPRRHCEERSDEAIQNWADVSL